MEIQSGAVQPVGAIEEGWNIIKDEYWIFFAMTLVFIVIMFAISFAVGLVNNAITLGVTAALGATVSKGSADVAVAIAPQLISATISIFTSIIIATISGMFMCGLMSALARKADTGRFEFNDLFSGFSKFQPCLIYSIVLSLIQYVILVGGILIGVAFGVSLSAESLLKDGKFDPNMVSGLIGIFLIIGLLALVFYVIVAICTVFVFPLIAERNLSGIEALTTSARGGIGNIFGLIGLFILQGLMLFVGALACLIGMLFVAPILYASLFAAYRSVFGRSNTPMFQSPPPPPVFNNQPSY
jgi:hypothetical protein